MPVLRARHGHAEALEDQNPRACARTHNTNPSRAAARCLGPSLAMPAPRPRRARPPPRRGRDVAFASRPSRWGFSSSTLRVLTLAHALGAHTYTHTPTCRTGSEPRRTRSRGGRHVGPPCQRRRRPEAAGLRGGEGEATSPAHGGKEAGLRRIQAEPSLVGPTEPAQLF
jgi:hypothetical protein